MIEYIKTSKLKPGDILYSNLYNQNDVLFLSKGVILTDKIIDIIKEMKFKGLYIKNDEEPDNINRNLYDLIYNINIIKDIKCVYNNTKFYDDIYDKYFAAYRKELEEDILDLVNFFYNEKINNRMMLDFKDCRCGFNWEYYHALNVAMISIGMSLNLGLSKDRACDIAFGAILHDLGKTYYKNKNASEKEIKENHAERIFRILQRLHYKVDTTYGIWLHHKREDNTGIQKGEFPDQILLSSRIIAVANCFDNMVYSIDNYHNEDETIEYLCANGRYNTECVKAFIKFVCPYPTGTRVLLSNGEVGVVIKNNYGLPLRPSIYVNKQLVNLDDINNITVIKTL